MSLNRRDVLREKARYILVVIMSRLLQSLGASILPCNTFPIFPLQCPPHSDLAKRATSAPLFVLEDLRVYRALVFCMMICLLANLRVASVHRFLTISLTVPAQPISSDQCTRWTLHDKLACGEITPGTAYSNLGWMWEKRRTAMRKPEAHGQRASEQGNFFLSGGGSTQKSDGSRVWRQLSPGFF